MSTFTHIFMIVFVVGLAILFPVAVAMGLDPRLMRLRLILVGICTLLAALVLLTVLMLVAGIGDDGLY